MHAGQIIALSPGVIFIAVGICIIMVRKNFIKNNEFIDAMAVKTFHRNNSRSHEYYPVYRYSVGGQTYQVPQPWGDPKPKYKQGEPVKLIYNRENPRVVVNPEVESDVSQFSRMFIQNGKEVDARVVMVNRHVQSYNYRSSGHGYFTIFRYLVGGQAYQIKEPMGTRKPKWKDGEIVKLVYSRKKPEKIVHPENKDAFLMSTIFISIGVVLTVIFLLLMMGIIS